MGPVFLVPVFVFVASLIARWPQERKQAENAKTNAEARAITYLSREVPRWSAENKCYSCHNNGDAARALYAAKRLGRPVNDAALADTTRWVSKPAGWDHNGGEGEFNDKRLARLQFAASLSEAKEGGWGPYVTSAPEVFDTAVVVLALTRQPPSDDVRALLTRGRRYLLAEQQADGSWNETTRPGGGVSYAERLSTTGWATQALL